MKQSALAFSLLVAAVTITPTFANELKPFDGFYAGLHGGYSWQKMSGTYDNAGAATNLAGIDLNGAIVGGQLGYNVQVNSILLGIEGDASGYAGSDDSVTNVGATATTVLTGDISYLASIRGRLGVVMGNVLLYGTAGVGFVEYKFNANAASVPFDQSFRLRDTNGVYGGGLEWKIVEGVSIRGEYLHYDVKASSAIPGNFPDTDSGDRVNFHDIDVARAGINISLSP